MPSPPPELLTVIVPCFNEVLTLERTVEEVYETAPCLDVEVEVLLCDDGSTDGTGELMEALAERMPRCRVMRNPKNLGIGSTVIRAYELVRPRSWVTVLPGDGELVFASIQNLLALRESYDLVLGYWQNAVIRTTRRRLASGAFTFVANSLYGYKFRYLNGLKLYRVEVFRGIETVSSGHAMNAELIAKAILRKPDLRIGEAPFVARGRAKGSSKAFRPSSIARALRETAQGYRAVSAFRDRVVRASVKDEDRR